MKSVLILDIEFYEAEINKTRWLLPELDKLRKLMRDSQKRHKHLILVTPSNVFECGATLEVKP